MQPDAPLDLLMVGVLTRGHLEQSATRWAQGGIAAVLGGDPDSTDLHLADTLAGVAGIVADLTVRAPDPGPIGAGFRLVNIPIPDDLAPVMAAHLTSQVGAVTPPAAAVADAVGRALHEDLEPDGDLSAALVPVGAVAVGAIVARSAGVLAGSACAEEAFRQVDPSIRVTWRCSDGGRLVPGDVVADVRGPRAPTSPGRWRPPEDAGRGVPCTSSARLSNRSVNQWRRAPMRCCSTT